MLPCAARPSRMLNNKTLERTAALRKRQEDGQGLNLEKVREINKENGLPLCPLAVTRLELNCQLLEEISPVLSAYVDCIDLHLERNSISVIENLGTLQKLQCLYLSNNRLQKIQGLDQLACLKVLDLSHNELTTVEGLSGLCSLEALLLSSNRLTDTQSMQHLSEVTTLVELDVSHNRLKDAGVIHVLEALPLLQTLTMVYNPLSAAATPGNREVLVLPHYRRTLISRLKALTALDHKPVFPQERVYAEAWRAGTDGGGLATAQYAVQANEGSMLPQGLPTDILHPVMACLGMRTLVMTALTSKWWAISAAALLSIRRVEHAQAAMTAAELRLMAGPGQAELGQISKAEVTELMAISQPPRPLVQLLYALEVLWLKRQRCMARKAHGATPAAVTHARCNTDGGAAAAEDAVGVVDQQRFSAADLTMYDTSQVQAPAVPCATQEVMSHAVEGSGTSQSGQGYSGHEEQSTKPTGPSTCQAAPFGLQQQGEAPDQRATTNADVAAAAVHSQATAASQAAEEPGSEDSCRDDAGIASDGEEGPELDNASWRACTWWRTLPMTQETNWLSDLQAALPLSARMVRELRARTGTADDLEHYVPQLEADDVARSSLAFSTICTWLLNVEAHAHAVHMLRAAYRWTWPLTFTGHSLSPAASPTHVQLSHLRPGIHSSSTPTSPGAPAMHAAHIAGSSHAAALAADQGHDAAGDLASNSATAIGAGPGPSTMLAAAAAGIPNFLSVLAEERNDGTGGVLQGLGYSSDEDASCDARSETLSP